MKRLLKTLTLTTVLAAPTALAANPYCSELADVAQLPKKYAKRGPIHVDATAGWIISADQMKADFTVSDETAVLWGEITAVFAAKGVKLAALIAPPRPLFAPEMVQSTGYNAKEATAGFSAYIAALNAAGIVAPDLSELASAPIASEYYFARDTHWTPKGAAVSAAHLAQKITGRPISDTMAGVRFDESYAEKGSLSMVVEDTCGSRPEIENVPAPVYTQQGGASALLADESGPTIALVGTSFSDRYQRDAYQVASAVSHALEVAVDNFSVTGGGLVGAMEAFIASGALDSGRYQTVVWEAPYTTPLTNSDGLRQILGALQRDGAKTEVFSGGLKSDWVPVKHSFSIADYRAVSIHAPDVTEGKLEIEFYDSDGHKSRTKLVKSNRVQADVRSDVWSLSLAALPLDDVARLKVKLKGGAKTVSIYLIQ